MLLVSAAEAAMANNGGMDSELGAVDHERIDNLCAALDATISARTVRRAMARRCR
ncbi:MAG: hypothetical protein ACE367_05095 [Acidimicrobiales bacterium]